MTTHGGARASLRARARETSRRLFSDARLRLVVVSSRVVVVVVVVVHALVVRRKMTSTTRATEEEDVVEDVIEDDDDDVLAAIDRRATTTATATTTSSNSARRRAPRDASECAAPAKNGVARVAGRSRGVSSAVRSGPPGCGKATAIKCVAEEAGYEVRKWQARPALWREYSHAKVDGFGGGDSSKWMISWRTSRGPQNTRLCRF